MSDAEVGAWKVPAALEGERVDRMVSILTGLSRTAVAAGVAAGQVRVGGRAVRGGARRVHAGERVEVDPELLVLDAAPSAPDGDASVVFDVVYEDEDLVVVDKPAGLVVHPGAGQSRGTLVHGLVARYPELAELGIETDSATRPGIVHRLDKGTSGLLMVARNAVARDGLTAQLAARAVERRYEALVWGRVQADEGLIDAPLGRSVSDPTRMAVKAGGRAARTRYAVEQRYDLPAVSSLLACRLETGRTHQIRVHLASIGHPVIGDDRYGRRGHRGTPGWPPLAAKRPFLHASTLGFEHPVSGQRLQFRSELPAELVGVLATLHPEDRTGATPPV